MSTTQQNDNVLPIKLHIHHRKGPVDSRRFLSPATYEELRTVIQHLMSVSDRRLSIEYVDDDGDNIRITSAAEWAECLRLFRTSPRAPQALVLHARKLCAGCKNERRRDRHAPAAATPVDAAAAAAQQSDASSYEGEGSVAWDRTASQEAAGTPPTAASGPVRPQFPAGAIEDTQRAALDLMSNLFQCDAEAVLADARKVVGHAISRVVSMCAVAGRNMHVDINELALRVLAVREGNDRIERGEHAQAESLLSAAARVFQNDAVILYNLACAQARQVKVDEALESLRRAVAAGYDNALHMASDMDLASLRADGRYLDILRQIARSAAPSASAEPSAQPSKTSATSQPSQSTPTPVVDSPRTTAAKQLQEIFPHLTLVAARDLAHSHRNVVEDAVNALLHVMSTTSRP